MAGDEKLKSLKLSRKAYQHISLVERIPKMYSLPGIHLNYRVIDLYPFLAAIFDISTKML